MLYWSAVFFVLTVIATVLGFGGILVAGMASIAKILACIFFGAFVASLLMGVYWRGI